MSDQQQVNPPRRALCVWFGDVMVIVHPDDPLYEDEYRFAVQFCEQGTPMPYADAEQGAGEATE
jgi:hypothetical protein